MSKDFFKNIDKNILKFMISGLNFSFIISNISLVILFFYILNPISYLIYEAGIIIFKTSLLFAAFFFICAIATNKLKKEIG